MPKPEWGAKRTCASCGARFYDLNADPILCPECGETFQREVLVKGRRGRAAPVERKAYKPDESIAETETEEAVIDDDSDDDAAAPAAATADDDAVDDDALTPAEDVLLESEDSDDDDDLGEFGGESDDDEDRR